jgi:hypothetical protein
MGNSEGKRTVWRPERRWEDNNKADLKEIGHEGLNCNHLAHDMDSSEHCNKLSASIKGGEFD